MCPKEDIGPKKAILRAGLPQNAPKKLAVDQKTRVVGAAPDPRLGEVIDGRYQITARIGEGGMGVVYRARHVILGKSVAVKILRADVSSNEQIVGRFQQEAQSASAIGNEHIVDISDFGFLADGSAYFTMELLDGRSLSKVLAQERPLDPYRAAHITFQLTKALGAAHGQGIVHRDMKPDNVILIEKEGNPDFVKVLDFGIAKVAGASSKLTQAGEVFGTPHYMSPEQCAGKPVDHRTDVYALGIILYEMVSGRVPFDADDLMGILTKQIYEPPTPPRELSPPTELPELLEAIIMKALAKVPEQRFASMSEFRKEIELFLEPSQYVKAASSYVHPAYLPQPSGGGLSHRQPSKASQTSWSGWVIAIALGCLGVLGAAWWWAGRPAQVERSTERKEGSVPQHVSPKIPPEAQKKIVQKASQNAREGVAPLVPAATPTGQTVYPDGPSAKHGEKPDKERRESTHSKSKSKRKSATRSSGGSDVVDPWSQ